MILAMSAGVVYLIDLCMTWLGGGRAGAVEEGGGDKIERNTALAQKAVPDAHRDARGNPSARTPDAAPF
jgi:hypothetical protein